MTLNQKGNLMSKLTVTQKVGIILVVVGLFIVLAVGLVPDIKAVSPYSHTTFSCGSGMTVFFTDTNPGVAHECNGAAANQLLRGSLAGGLWVLTGTCLIVLFPKSTHPVA